MEWKAKWVWIPEEEKNTYVYFRKSFDIRGKVERAAAYISADSRYKLYVNGKYLGRGPARCDPLWQYYDEYDLGPHLRRGDNVIAVLVHYYGAHMPWYVLGRPGLLFQSEIRVNSDTLLIKSDTTWKAMRSRAWKQDALQGQLGFMEICDAGKAPEGWERVDFDESGWQEPIVVLAQYAGMPQGDVPPIGPWPFMVPRDIPLMSEKEVFPRSVVEVAEVTNKSGAENIAGQMDVERTRTLSEGKVRNPEALLHKGNGQTTVQMINPRKSVCILLDFGKEVTGYPRISLDGVAGGIVDIGVSESLRDGRIQPTKEGIHVNRLIMRDGPQSWEFFNWKGFRYLQLTFRRCTKPVRVNAASVNFMTYPVQKRGSFRCSDKLLTRLWKVGAYTAQMCMHDGYEDCPSREQRQWFGDAYVQILVNYAAFGDAHLVRKLLRQGAQSQRADGATKMYYPGDNAVYPEVIPDYCLSWIMEIWDYYMYVGANDIVRELYPNVIRVMDWFAKYLDNNNLLNNVPHWVFIDWGNVDKRGEITALNALYYRGLIIVSRMAAMFGDGKTGAKYGKLARRVKQAINLHLWDDARGVYIDCRCNGIQSRRVGQQANGAALAFGIPSLEMTNRIVSYVFDEKRLKLVRDEKDPGKAGFDEEHDVLLAQPFFMHFVIRGLTNVNRFDIAMRYFRSRWGEMLRQGATTLWETWGRKQSECHAWAATPTYQLSTEILGVRLVKPGFAKFEVSPRVMDLKWASGVFPSVRGDIRVSWRKEKGMFSLEVTVPGSSLADIGVPVLDSVNPEVCMNRRRVWSDGTGIAASRISKSYGAGQYIRFVVGEGDYRFLLRGNP